MAEAGGGYILIVTSSNKRVVDFFDTTSGTRIGRIENIVAQPHEIACSAARREAYVTSTYRTGAYAQPVEKSHEITVIDVDARAVADIIDISPFVAPHDIEYDQVRDLIYASAEKNGDGQNGIVIIDAKSRSVVGNVPTAGVNSHWMALTPDCAQACVAHKEEEFISVIDLENRKVSATVPVPGGAEEIDISHDGSAAFVVTPAINVNMVPDAVTGSGLVKIDIATAAVAGHVPIDPVNHGVRALSDGRVLVSQMLQRGDAGRGSLHVVDPDRMTRLARIELGRMPFTVRATPDAKAAFVANFGAGTVSVVDLLAYEVTRTLESTPDPQLGGTHGLSLLPAG